MWRLVFVIALGGLICASPVQGQGPKGKEDVKKLQAELSRLKERMQELEARIKKAKGEATRAAGKRPDSGHHHRHHKGKGWAKGKEWAKGKDFGKGKEWARGKDFGKGRFDPEKMQEFRNMMEKARKEMQKKFGEKKDVKTPLAKPSADLEQRLDRILREVEELRREIRQKKK
jgi:outer membrane murein-binding lipoprotein Lpp